MGDESWTDKVDRVGRAVWELRHGQPEVGYVRVDVYVDEGDPVVLATDVAGGVIWVDQAGDNNRQVIYPDGRRARNAAWLAKRRWGGNAPD